MSEKRGGSKGDQGYWIKYTVDIAEHPHHCSECGWSDYHIDRYVKDFNFCPNCGKKMNGSYDALKMIWRKSDD